MFPCNCRPPFPRPEPFSPLPRPGKVPDWGKWIRDRLAEKGALLAFPTRAAFPSAGSAPNLYLAEDTGVVYRWGGEGYAVLVDPSASDVETYPGRGAFPDTGRAGVIYIDASANLLYRWNGTGYVLLTTDLSGVESRLAGVESKVPAQATAQNQLADKAFVNSSIATNTAFYISDNRRPFQSLADLESYEGALTNNDYAFVVGRDAAGNTTYTRYKWNEATEAWAEEYVLNNSSFTAEQWAAISSGITSGLVAKLGALPTAEALAQALAGKQDALTFDNAPTSGSNNPVKSGGIWSAIWGALTALPTGFTSLYDWVVSRLSEYRHKLDLNVYGYGNPTVSFADGFSVSYGEGGTEQKYTAPSGGETMTFIGPVPSSNEFTPNYKFYYPSYLGNLDSFDPNNYSVWCLVCDNGGTIPSYMMYMTGPDYSIGSFNSETPTLTLSVGEATGDAPTMARPIGATGDTLAKASQMPAVVAPSTSASDSGKAADAKATGDALAGKLSTSGGTVTGDISMPNGQLDAGDVVTRSYFDFSKPNESPKYLDSPENSGKALTDADIQDSSSALGTEFAGKANRAANPTNGNLAALDANGNPTDSGVKASGKLDSTSAAPAFSADSSISYAVGSHCTYNGKLYKCTTATTGGTWDASKWTADTMTDPDAVLDITAQNQLRVVAKDGTVLWAQGYDLASTSSATLACDATNNFTFADGATTQAFTLPTAPTGKVGDFGLDIDNSANASAATMTLTGLDTTFSVVVPKGESLNDMLAIAAGELAQFYVTLTTFRVNNLPTWHIVKQIVENGGAQS